MEGEGIGRIRQASSKKKGSLAMSQSNQPPGSPGEKNLFGKIGYRRLAILIMLTGAAGFVAALLIFDEQIQCLLGSTIVTMLGLGVNIAAKRLGLTPVEAPSENNGTFGEGPGRVKAPPSLRGKRGKPGLPPVGDRARSEEQPDRVLPGSLADRVMAVLESQGAQVGGVTYREGRCMIEATQAQGERITALVLEGSQPAAVSDARALLSIVNRSTSGMGFLIADTQFSSEMTNWAADRQQIRLVNAGDLDTIILG